MSPGISIETMTAADWPMVRHIFEEGIATGNATFDTQAPSWDAWNAAHSSHSRFVAKLDGIIVGWIALSPTSDRCCYVGVAEVSYYVAERMRGRGVGRALLTAVIRSSEEHGIWTLTAGVFPENLASVHLLESAGFRLVGRRERLGSLNGEWRDVLSLERRSKTVGCPNGGCVS